MQLPSPDTLSLFAGLGGLDLGAKVAGLRVGLSLDNDKDALLKLSRALGHPVLATNIEDLDPDVAIEAAGVGATGCMLIGGPPCTPFSHAGFWIKSKRDGEDPQWGRIADYGMYVAASKPRAFVLENVPGLLFKNHQPVLGAFLRRMKRLGYSTAFRVLDAADFGVPQHRRRLFVVGIRGRHAFEFPRGTTLTRPRTAAWAFKGLARNVNAPESDEMLRGKYADLLPAVPPGDNYLHFTSRRGHAHPLFGWRTRYWSFLYKLDPKRPSITIPATRITNNGPFHWRNRHLRIRELARIQGFPDNFPAGQGPLARRHIGNAVPPLLAAEVLWAVRMYLGEVSTRDAPQPLTIAGCSAATANEVYDSLAAFVSKA